MILIVEDDRMLMMGLQVALKTKGSQVLQAGSVREALSVYDQCGFRMEPAWRSAGISDAGHLYRSSF